MLVSHADQIPECNRANDAHIYTIVDVAPHFVDSTLDVLVARDTSNPTIQTYVTKKQRNKNSASDANGEAR